MNNERKQVLQLLAEGKVSAEEAEKLLDKLNSSQDVTASERQAAGGLPEPKFMVVHVDSSEGDVVDVKLPIALLRSGIKLSAMMPKDAAAAMANTGIDFSQLGKLTGDDFITALHAMKVDVVSKEGDTVKIFCA